MAKIQAVWAIDIGQAALKAIKLVPGESPSRLWPRHSTSSNTPRS